ncbi:MAG: hypothetical protein ACLRRF_06905 [Clostridium fessum]
MEQKGQNGQEQILVGIDVGSTTTKVAVMEVATGKVLFSDYTRHHSDQLQSVSRAVKLVKETIAGRSFLTAMTGSGAKHLSEELEIPYVQEVVANSIALKAMYGKSERRSSWVDRMRRLSFSRGINGRASCRSQICG